MAGQPGARCQVIMDNKAGMLLQVLGPPCKQVIRKLEATKVYCTGIKFVNMKTNVR